MKREEDNILKGNPEDNFDEILRISSRLKVPASKQAKEAAWEQLVNSMQSDDVERPKVIPIYAIRKFWYSIAATLLVLITITSLTYRFKTVAFQLSKGQTTSKILPDSSEVMLNSESKIEYRRFGWLADREISLSGEAFFSVKQGSQFTVLSDFNRKVIVTGTKFNVLARGDQFEVKCFDGSVTVQTSVSKTISLTKGKGIVISKIEEPPSQITLDSITEPTWIKGEYYFNDVPLNLVFDELSRQFNVTIKHDGFVPATRNYTGFFKRTRLVQALDLICIPMDLTYQISSDSTSVMIKK
jgi:transmembrane sensor